MGGEKQKGRKTETLICNVGSFMYAHNSSGCTATYQCCFSLRFRLVFSFSLIRLRIEIVSLVLVLITKSLTKMHFSFGFS